MPQWPGGRLPGRSRFAPTVGAAIANALLRRQLGELQGAIADLMAQAKADSLRDVAPGRPAHPLKKPHPR